MNWELQFTFDEARARREAIFPTSRGKMQLRRRGEGRGGEGRRVLRFLRCRAHTIRPKRSRGRRKGGRRGAAQVQIHGRVSNKRVECSEREQGARGENVILMQYYFTKGVMDPIPTLERFACWLMALLFLVILRVLPQKNMSIQ